MIIRQNDCTDKPYINRGEKIQFWLSISEYLSFDLMIYNIYIKY